MQTTFSIIKPDAVSSGKAGKILSLLEAGGFRIAALKMVKLSQPQAEGFYAVHRERPFFGSLVKFMTEGPVIVMALQREDAVKKMAIDQAKKLAAQKKGEKELLGKNKTNKNKK